MKLLRLKAGESAVIDDIELDGQIKTRFLELGMTVGTVVRFVKRAPLGDPIEFELRDTRLCLRKSEAKKILVNKL